MKSLSLLAVSFALIYSLIILMEDYGSKKYSEGFQNGADYQYAFGKCEIKKK